MGRIAWLLLLAATVGASKTAPTCQGDTVNALDANLVYWDHDVHQWAKSKQWCSEGVLKTSTGFLSLPVSPPTSSTSFDAASTITISTAVALATVADVFTTVFTAANISSTSTRTATVVVESSKDLSVAELTATLTAPNQPAITAPGGRPMIVFSSIEIERLIMQGNSCVTQHTTTKLPTPAIAYLTQDEPSAPWPSAGTATGPLASLTVTGIPSDLAQMTLGSYTGLPTVIIASYSLHYSYGCIMAGEPMAHLVSESIVGPPNPTTSSSSQNTSPPSQGHQPNAGVQPGASIPANAAVTLTTAPTTTMPISRTVVTSTHPPVFTLNHETFTANAGSTFVIRGKTLAPGGKIKLHHSTIELGQPATALTVIHDQITSIITLHGQTQLVTQTAATNSSNAAASSTAAASTNAGTTGVHLKHTHHHNHHDASAAPNIGDSVASGVGGLNQGQSSTVASTTVAGGAAAGEWNGWPVAVAGMALVLI